jgi:23S rRNA pseudouridine1911/1915/1917 synthase
MTERIRQSVAVPDPQAGLRFDQAAATLFPDYSRAQLQQWIREGALTCNHNVIRPRDPVRCGDQLQLDAVLVAREDWTAQPLALDIVYEDEAVLVINKPLGMVVHPAAGTRDGTLLNALLHHDATLATLPRAGIVHRLDKDTTGLLVVARTLAAHADLVRQLQARTVTREYEAIACGVLISGGTVNAPMGRHPRDRKKMGVVAGGKPAVTHYRVIRRFERHTHVRVKLETGRTHQIRVHMSHLGHPLLGDVLYGARLQLPSGVSDQAKQLLAGFKRQALHAATLGLVHPLSRREVSWSSPLPVDFQAVLDALNENQDIVGMRE